MFTLLSHGFLLVYIMDMYTFGITPIKYVICCNCLFIQKITIAMCNHFITLHVVFSILFKLNQINLQSHFTNFIYAFVCRVGHCVDVVIYHSHHQRNKSLFTICLSYTAMSLLFFHIIISHMHTFLQMINFRTW